MKQVACVNSLSSSSTHTSALFSCSIGHVARKSNDKLMLNTYLNSHSTKTIIAIMACHMAQKGPQMRLFHDAKEALLRAKTTSF